MHINTHMYIVHAYIYCTYVQCLLRACATAAATACLHRIFSTRPYRIGSCGVARLSSVAFPFALDWLFWFALGERRRRRRLVFFSDFMKCVTCFSLRFIPFIILFTFIAVALAHRSVNCTGCVYAIAWPVYNKINYFCSLKCGK